MQNRRMHAHDYTRVGFYMITLVTADRRRCLFGECRDDRVFLSSAGKTVQQRWYDVSRHNPAIEASTEIIMPDHLHGILYVKEPMSRPLGQTVRGFKSGVTSELRKRLNEPGLKVWMEGFHDRVVMCRDTLDAVRRYIQDNPRRHCLRRANPDLFVRVNQLTSSRLPVTENWSGFGNQFLLERPCLLPVQVSRRISAEELRHIKAEVTEQTALGAVMVSPFISPGEREIAEQVMAQNTGSLILIKPSGFPPRYKPSGTYIDACAKGRLLVLSAAKYTGRRSPLTRDTCLKMNEWVRAICDG